MFFGSVFDMVCYDFCTDQLWFEMKQTKKRLRREQKSPGSCFIPTDSLVPGVPETFKLELSSTSNGQRVTELKSRSASGTCCSGFVGLVSTSSRQTSY